MTLDHAEQEPVARPHTRRQLPVPPAPVVGAALSGFVVGVILTLLLTGVVTGDRKPTAAQATLPPPSNPTDAQLYAQVKHLVNLKLGPSEVSKQSRLVSLHLLPVDLSPAGARALTDYRSVAIVFRLYNHPLGPAWRARAAKADVFAVMKAMYTSKLPIYDVQLQGRFPLQIGKQSKVRTVLEAFMSYEEASSIPWKRWGRDQEAHLWSVLTYKYMDPRFA